MRVPGTRTTWVVADNPAYAGRTPSPVEAICHDGSPFLTVTCLRCGAPNHIHETQLGSVTPNVIVSLGCATCHRRVDAPGRMFIDAFARMRADGWIA